MLASPDGQRDCCGQTANLGRLPFAEEQERLALADQTPIATDMVRATGRRRQSPSDPELQTSRS